MIFPFFRGGMVARCLPGHRHQLLPMAAVESMMKIQEVILRAMTKKIMWWQAAEIIGITDRHMRHWHWQY
jgi:hypothetical protein